ncbi:hypothetical protein J43TS9_47460 [Paenibacillus cineris]|nr:hypothetical protein J43TS9_47460 [Paenibacillus cineris]
MLAYSEYVQPHLIGKHNFLHYFAQTLRVADDLTRLYVRCRFHKGTDAYFHGIPLVQ